jgi:3'-phosphoadenosine 5'-phosphosulfate sulfotransferase (PAPS reductase)/FAD synthetase
MADPLEQIRLIPAREPEEIVAEALSLYKPIKAFVLFSGGKDSSVTLDTMWRTFPGLITGALHINTGIGLRSTREFAEKFCEDRGIRFHEARAPIMYEDAVRKNGFPGPAFHRRMYILLKQRALEAFVAIQKREKMDEIMLISGARAEESRRRMGTTAPHEKNGAQIWCQPLIDWSDRRMQSERERHSVEMSPSSSTLHISGECLCGAFGDPKELDLIETFFSDDPVVRRIRKLERELAAAGEPRCKWATPLEGDEAPTEPAGPMCVNCYKQPSMFDEAVT